ncbi:hypothetical protein [Sphingomonas sp.]|nr:hypothetical protein [Sphingomonas sp.]
MRVTNMERFALGCTALIFLLACVGIVTGYFKVPNIGTVVEMP